MPGKEINIGYGSLLNGIVWTGITNALVGHLSGVATTASDLLLNNNLAAEGVSALGVFAAFFVSDVVVREAMEGLSQWRRSKFMDKAAGWERVQAMLDEDRGVWLVTRGSGLDDLPKTKMATGKALIGNNVAVLSKAEFAAFEQKVARGGGVLKTYRHDTVSDQVSITTKVGGKLQSVDGAAAVQVLKDGEVVREEWYDAGVRAPQVGRTPQDDRGFRNLLRDWQERQSLEAKEGIIELVWRDIRFAANLLERPDFLDGNNRPLVSEAHNYVLSAKQALDLAFPDAEVSTTVYWASDRFDALRDWPLGTARGFVAGTHETLTQTMTQLDEISKYAPVKGPRV